MKRRVVWADEARGDYLGIIRHIAGENPQAAARVADRTDDAAAALSDYAMGRAGRVTGTYEKVITGLPYILAYEFVTRPEGDERVAILHVIHTARNWSADQWPEELSES